MDNRLISYIENSFLASLIQDRNVTDISFNGEALYYLNNLSGRGKADVEVGKQEAIDFIRQVANLSEKQFSYASPILDVSVGRYRINAVHSSIARVKDDKTISFSIRIASYKNKIQNDDNFMSLDMREYLLNLIKNKESIVIAGPTGTGKTELQKYLLMSIERNAHIIAIDNIQELEGLRNEEDIDLTSWQVYPSMADRTFESLIRNALRNNPDWLIVAESRGKEMADILLSVTSGHPIITTMHANTLEEIPIRIARMIQLNNPNQLFEDVLSDVKNNFHNYVLLERTIDEHGYVKRFIKGIAYLKDANSNIEIVKERKYEKA